MWKRPIKRLRCVIKGECILKMPKMLKNEWVPAKIGVDIDESEPSETAVFVVGTCAEKLPRTAVQRILLPH